MYLCVFVYEYAQIKPFGSIANGFQLCITLRHTIQHSSGYDREREREREEERGGEGRK